jgi:alanyl-tRNA synthetase
MSKVAKYSGNFQQDAELDKSYRLYADHIRAITVALSDGILPQTKYRIN